MEVDLNGLGGVAVAVAVLRKSVVKKRELAVEVER